MRLLFGVCALAAFASATAPRCTAQAGATRANQDRSTDTLRLSRRQAVAAALTGNAQIEVARQQTREAAARRVTAIAIPDPQFTAGFDQETSPFAFNGAPSRPVTLGLSVPFPRQVPAQQQDRLADIGDSQANLRLQQQTIALEASATYDSLLVALLHRQNLLDAQKLAQDFLDADEGALRGRNGRQARRHSGAGHRRAVAKRSHRQRTRPAERAGVAQPHARTNHRRADRSDGHARAAAHAPRFDDDRADRVGESPGAQGDPAAAARPVGHDEAHEGVLASRPVVRRRERLLDHGIGALHDRNLAPVARFLLAARARRHRARRSTRRASSPRRTATRARRSRRTCARHTPTRARRCGR